MNAFAVAVVSLTLALSSDPYVRSKVDSANPDSHCFWWPGESTITYVQNSLGNAETTGDTEFTAVEAAFTSWQQVMNDCGSLTLTEGPRTSSRKVGYDTSSGASNENVVLFRTRRCQDVVPTNDPCINAGTCGNAYDCWGLDSAHTVGTIALTTSTYDPATGKLYDADIELNAANFTFTTVNSPICTAKPYPQTCVAYDVQNTVTHEAGHLLGLDHTSYPGSIMNPTAPLGDLSKRTIDPGSHQFVCDVYPKGRPAVDCASSSQKGGCEVVPELAGAEVLLAVAALLRRRRAR